MREHHPVKTDGNDLRLVFWETTTACNLKCVHCRASAQQGRPPDELGIEESRALLASIASFARPVVVLSGGEPLIRPDIFDIASYGTELGIRMVLATNGTLLTREAARRLAKSGIQRVSVSLDGADAATHDAFRGVSGSYARALRGIENAKTEGLSFQINTSVARHNIGDLPAVLGSAISLGACALHLFLLVPTGCGKELGETEMIGADEYEQVLNWLFDQSKCSPISLKATCAPHYFRVMRQRAKAEYSKITPETRGLEAVTKGCLAGSAVCFISWKGDVYPCGYFPVSAGSILTSPLSTIWRESPLFTQLRDTALLQGKCGICEYSLFCGGCRARAVRKNRQLPRRRAILRVCAGARQRIVVG